jgi:hypothetical protein
MSTCPEIHRVSIQLRRPTGPNDPGAADWCSYFIEGNRSGDVVVLCGRDGVPLIRHQPLTRNRRRGEPKPLLRWERKLRKDEDPLRAAKELLMQRYLASKKGTGRGPIQYPPLGIY